MRKIEKSEKRFNFIDVLIILAVICIALSVIFRAQLTVLFGNGERRSDCIIEFQSEAVPNESVPYISEGLELSWVESDVKLGTLRAVNISPSDKYILGNDGKYDRFDDKQNSAIVGTISASVLEDDGCYVGGTAFLAPGMTITVCSENVQFEITVLKITY